MLPRRAARFTSRFVEEGGERVQRDTREDEHGRNRDSNREQDPSAASEFGPSRKSVSFSAVNEIHRRSRSSIRQRVDPPTAAKSRRANEPTASIDRERSPGQSAEGSTIPLRRRNGVQQRETGRGDAPPFSSVRWTLIKSSSEQPYRVAASI